MSSEGTLQSPSTFSGSTKSVSSGLSGVEEKEMDLTKDNAASPIDLECHIQAERITKVLDELIYKTKLAITLPHLVQEYRTLSSILSEQHMDDLIFIFEQYDHPLFSTSLLNIAAMEDLKHGDVSLKNRLNPELGHLMYILNSYPELKGKVNERLQAMRVEYAASRDLKFSQTSLEYLMNLEHFRDQMVAQMEATAAEELDDKLSLRKLEASNDKLKESIKDLTKSLKDENEQFDDLMKSKAIVIDKLQQELAFARHDASMRVKKQILDSERQMVLASRAHAMKSEILKEEEVESKEAYEQHLRNHLLEEKNQRARRFKVETQLLSWLQKYDIEMGDKQVELDEFVEKYEDEMEKCNQLEEKLAEQDKEFIPLMEEREKEYHQEMTEKLEKFIVEHAARVIQCAWRDVLANRAEKRKLKKLQKKMLAEQAAAEKAAAIAAAAAARAAKAAAKAAKKAKS